MLRASLPLSPVMTITLNGKFLLPSKIDEEVEAEWQIGRAIELSEIRVPGKKEDEHTAYAITANNDPYPHVSIDGITGKITGCVKLYRDRISGGKSDLEGASHGFFVNVLGRVINLNENHFGLKNLSHGPWAQFRATVRADWLDAYLSVNRESLQETPEVEAFRAFLLALFNKARTEYNKSIKASMPDAGDILTQHYGSLPLRPLRRAVSEGLNSIGNVAPYIWVKPDADRVELAESWGRTIAKEPTKVVGDVVLEKLGQDKQLVAYSPVERRVMVNEEHPFSREHATTKEQKELLRDAALADLMTYAYMSEIGISDGDIQQILNYKDETLRLLAKLRRRTAAQLAEMLRECNSHAKGLERALDESFEQLGFIVEPLAQPGEPEGVAVAPLTPVPCDPEKPHEGDMVRSYSFTYDAKSTTKKKAQTGNVHTAGLSRHRKNHGAEHAIVVAPDFQEGALTAECEELGITPMRTDDLANLLVGVATSGAMDYVAFESVFDLRHPDEVSKWVESFVHNLRCRNAFGLDLFFKALAELEFAGPDLISTDRLSAAGRKLTGLERPTRQDILALAKGLEMLVPSMIRVEHHRDIVIDANPPAIRQAIIEQLSELPPSFRLDFGA